MDMTGSGYSDLHLLDATTGAREGASHDPGDNFVEMFDGYQSTGDLFELVRPGGGRRVMEVPPPAVSPASPCRRLKCLRCCLSRLLKKIWRLGSTQLYVARSSSLVIPAEMEALLQVQWLWVISKCSPRTQARGRRTSNSRDRRETAGARRSKYSETHRLAEKRRRCKVNERFKTLQQLVPGCHKCNQASTLDQTIQYMKSLQQQVQSMSSVAGCSMRLATEAAVYPLAPPLYIQPTAGAIAPPPPILPPALCRCSCSDGDVCRAAHAPTGAPSHSDADDDATSNYRTCSMVSVEGPRVASVNTRAAAHTAQGQR